jgi:hypothetical protein
MSLLATGFDSPVDCSSIAGRARAAGNNFLARYYGPPSSRNKTLLASHEAKSICAAGLKIVSLWEAAGNHYAAFTAATGGRDAEEALLHAQAAH